MENFLFLRKKKLKGLKSGAFCPSLVFLVMGSKMVERRILYRFLLYVILKGVQGLVFPRESAIELTNFMLLLSFISLGMTSE